MGLGAVTYLVLNHPLGLIWRSLPAKEIAIGVLFTAGTVVALLPRPLLTPAFAIAVAAFAALCSLNCISIASWERDLDRAQGKVSIATLHPGVIYRVGRFCFCLAAGSLVLAFIWRAAIAFFLCVSTSALLLGYLNASRSFSTVGATALGHRKNAWLPRQSAVATTSDQRTALADVVLLTPLLALIWAAL